MGPRERRIGRFLLAVLIAVAIIPAASQAKTPRQEILKPTNAVVLPGYDASRIEVKFQDDLDIYIDASGKLAERSKRALVSIRATTVLSTIEAAGGDWARLIEQPETVVDGMRLTAETNLGRAIADLNTFFILRVPDGQSAEDWMNSLNSLDEVEITNPMPLPQPAPVPGSFVDNQGYLDPATNGIDAEYAWTWPGGTGANVTITDLEYSWNTNHQDLPGVTVRVPGGETPTDPFADNNHGTAVLGEMGSLNNGFGTTGAAYDAALEVAPVAFLSGYNLAAALLNAAINLVPGDVMLIEQQISGPNGAGMYVPSEWNLGVYTVIQAAVGAGIHVVEAAGNGNQNLDGAEFNAGHAPFLPANDSGAIIVGAGAAPAGFGGSDTDRSRLGFSTYGSRVNLQGWGENVVTTGYGFGYNAEGVDLWYTGSFNGTSSASPIVTSAVGLVESVFEQLNGGATVSPGDMRTHLMNTGSPQQAGTNPVSENIGPRPNLRAALAVLDTEPPVVSCPDTITVECSDFCGTPAADPQLTAWAASFSAVDNVDPSPDTFFDNPDCFSVGTTRVIYTAVDDIGNAASCTTAVIVVDATPPVVSCPDTITVECVDYCGVPASDPQLAAWGAAFSAGDVCDSSLDLELDNPTCFPLGITRVIYKATDNAGNAASCTTAVIVEDTTPPDIDIVWNRYELWPPNHKMVDIFPRFFSITDICCEPDWVLESIESNEPDNGRGDGNTVGDIAEADTGTTDTEFQLRSERSGKGDGRKYTIIYRAWDCSGNVAQDTSCIYVPHDQGFTALVAAYGFTNDGTSFDGSRTFMLAIPSSPAVYDTKGSREILVKPAVIASEIDVSRVYVGNSVGAVIPESSRLQDVNDDGLKDLVLTYVTEPAGDIPTGTWITIADGLGNAATPGDLGLHFRSQDDTPYLVSDIFALGTPVTIHEEEEEPIADKGGDDPLLDLTPGVESPKQFDTDLRSVFPNPFNPTTTISFTLANPSDVKIAVYDVRGALVSLLVDINMPSGEHNVDWHGFDDAGRRASSGVYFVRMIVGDFEKTRKMVMLK